MIILVVEDLPEEQERAKTALRELGFKPAIAGTLSDARRIWQTLGEKVKGIITDLHFPEGENGGILNANQDSGKPCGLAMVASAVGCGLPVVVCSDIDHHRAMYVRIVIDALCDHPAYAQIGDVPVVMDCKDWERAGEELKRLISEKGEKS